MLYELQPAERGAFSLTHVWNTSRGALPTGVPREVTREQQTQQLVPSFVAAQRTGNSLDNCSERCRQATICGQRLKSKKSFPAKVTPSLFVACKVSYLVSDLNNASFSEKY